MKKSFEDDLNTLRLAGITDINLLVTAAVQFVREQTSNVATATDNLNKQEMIFLRNIP